MYSFITYGILSVLTVHKLLWMQEERTMLAKELSSLQEQREQLKAEVEKYKECDPQVVEEIRKFITSWGFLALKDFILLVAW